MHTITLVTSNPGKLAEWQKLFPDRFTFIAADIDLDEIQSMDLDAIVIDKAKRAYQQIQAPVLVEDVSTGLDKLGGLPGPFMKYFEQRLGQDALFKLAQQAGDPVTITCTVGYYDGSTTILAHGELKATVVAPRGSNGFGFDPVVVPNGQSKTFAEMSIEQKNKLSHRSMAARSMVQKLTEFYKTA